MPKVSVVIPSYNCASSVCNAVESVFAQTMQDFEIILVDDGSTDDTRAVLGPYFSNPKFRYIHQQNRGAPGARNTGSRASNAEYLAFLDADDLLSPRALELMAGKLDTSHASWCLIDPVRIRLDHTAVRRTTIPQGDLLLGILKDDFVGRCMFFRRTDFIEVGMFDETLRCLEDWDINIRMFEQQKPFAYLDLPVYTYIWRQGSLITDQRKMAAHTEQMLRKNHKRLADGGDREVAKIYAQAMWDLARRYWYGVRDYKRALACVGESLAYDFSLTRLLHPLIHKWQRRRAQGSLAHSLADVRAKELESQPRKAVPSE